MFALGSSTAVADVGSVELPAGWKFELHRVDPRPGEEAALVSPIIYLNRCVGGCALTPGTEDDAVTNKTHPSLLDGAVNLDAFVHGDQVWNDLVTCVKEIYSPFDVQITETRPAAGTQYHMAVIGGTAQQAGKDQGVLGVAVVRSDCAPRNNAISLNFANSASGSGSSLVHTLCWIVGQESAHAFGLDHSFKWADGRSTCNDPLTYQTDCGGQKFFRNDAASCGEFEARPCNCGSTQNSHAKLLAVFGQSPAAPLIPPPTSTVTTPQAGGQLGAIVAASAGSKRGIAKVEMLLNGYEWGETKGAGFGPNGQPNPSSYSVMVPSNVPGGVIDVVMRACDDLGNCTSSAAVTVNKGPPCADASTCAAGQKCEAGKCFWDPPVGELGDTCTFPQFCKSNSCLGPEGEQICSQNCVPGSTDSCPDDLECVMTGAAQGICYTKSDGGGCCSVGDDDGPSPWFVHGGVSLLMLGLLLRRRRK